MPFRIPPITIHLRFSAAALAEITPWPNSEFSTLRAADRVPVLGPKVKVLVVDTGVAIGHEDLPGNILCRDFTRSQYAHEDKLGHGSHVLGSICATGLNAKGVNSPAWRHVEPLVGKALGDEGFGDDLWIEQALRWGLDNGCQLANLSLGSDAPSPRLRNVIRECNSHGMVVVCAAGNDGSGVDYPAKYPEAVAVSAFGRIAPGNYQIANFSNYGPEVSCTGPGVQILSTYLMESGGYGVLSGTSMATPFVVALLALWRAAHPNDEWNANAVRELIKNHSIDFGEPGFDVRFGNGMLDPGKISPSTPGPPPTGPQPPIVLPPKPELPPMRGKLIEYLIGLISNPEVLDAIKKLILDLISGWIAQEYKSAPSMAAAAAHDRDGSIFQDLKEETKKSAMYALAMAYGMPEDQTMQTNEGVQA